MPDVEGHGKGLAGGERLVEMVDAVEIARSFADQVERAIKGTAKMKDQCTIDQKSAATKCP